MSDEQTRWGDVVKTIHCLFSHCFSGWHSNSWFDGGTCRWCGENENVDPNQLCLFRREA